MDSFKRYIKKYGIPMSVYLDKHSTYKSPAEPTLEDELNGTEPLSEFGRAMHELGVELIHAHSPQAKGRIERLFNTLQDRMVKEMRLKGVSTIDEANRFLVHYLPVYNRRFAIEPNKRENLHVKAQRTVRNDHVIQHDTKLYQIENRIKLEKVVVEDRVDGTMRIRHGKLALAFHEIEKRPEKKKEEPPFKLRKTHKPSPDHPWRKSMLGKGPRGNMEKPPPLPHSPVTAAEARK